MNIVNHIRKGHKHMFLETMAMYCIGYLGLAKSKKTLVIMLSANQIKETGSKGITAIDGNNIIVCLDSRLVEDELMNTFAHEMVHVKQLATGLLTYSMQDDNEIITWRGKPVPQTVKYLCRKWELQAMAQSEIIMRKFCDVYNSMLGN